MQHTIFFSLHAYTRSRRTKFVQDVLACIIIPALFVRGTIIVKTAVDPTNFFVNFRKIFSGYECVYNIHGFIQNVFRHIRFGLIAHTVRLRALVAV